MHSVGEKKVYRVNNKYSFRCKAKSSISSVDGGVMKQLVRTLFICILPCAFVMYCIFIFIVILTTAIN